MTAHVLFLDVDGVLNSRAHRGQEHPGGMMGMAQEHVDQLLRVVHETRCLIVVSSTWRIGGIGPGSRFWRALSRRLGGHEILCRVIDRTVDRFAAYRDCDRDPNLTCRGDEVAEWLSRHPEVKRFAIVDDDADMGELLPHLVQTDFETGLTFEVANRLIEKLGVAGREVA